MSPSSVETLTVQSAAAIVPRWPRRVPKNSLKSEKKGRVRLVDLVCPIQSTWVFFASLSLVLTRSRTLCRYFVYRPRLVCGVAGAAAAGSGMVDRRRDRPARRLSRITGFQPVNSLVEEYTH